jgi:hypothetical protein
MHYTRWYRHGDPLIDKTHWPRHRRDIMERIKEKVSVSDDGCWEWQGMRLPAGYGQIFANGRHTYAHRAVIEYMHGPLETHQHVHHKCGNRACCNPDHLTVIAAGEHAAHHHRGEWVTKSCPTCGESFDTIVGTPRERIHCSRACYFACGQVGRARNREAA